MSISSILFCVLIALVTYFVLKVRKALNYWQSRGIACEQPSPIFGNLAGLQTKRTFVEILQSYYERFKGTGPFAGFYWFQRPAVFVLEPALIKHILIKDFNKFTDRGFYSNEKDDPLSGHLFLLDNNNNKWRNMRTKMTPTFTSAKIKYMFPTIIKVGKEFVDVFDEMIRKDEVVVEVRDVMARFTSDVIGACAFGIDCNSLKDPEAEFRIMGRRAIVENRYGRLGLAFVTNFPKLSRKMHVKMTPADIEDFFMRIARETVEQREQNNIRHNDFMDMLIDLKNNKLLKSDDGVELTNITLAEMAAQAFVFLVAGFDSSSTTMAFALYELARNQDIQQRAREEVMSVLDKYNQELTYESTKEMQYLGQIIQETLRLNTILPVLNRLCLEDFPVPGHPNYVIKKGMMVLIPAAALHRDNRYYDNAEVFNPDNFTPERVQEREGVEWLPFGEGPRNCIGMRFGLLQTSVGLALLLKNFKFSVCPQTVIPIVYDKMSFLVSPLNGISLKVERILG